MDSLEHIKETAALWATRRHGAQWSDADEVAFNQWLNASMSHRVEYLGHEKTWRDANRLKVLGAGARPGVIPTIDDWRASPYFKHIRFSESQSESLRRAALTVSEAAVQSIAERSAVRSARKYFALAASVLVLCTASYFGWNHLRGDRYSTSIGVTTAVPLPDGSKITLNTDSEIRVAVTQTERRINLDQGEAFFEVAKDPLRPFTVIAGDKHVVAVGTKFSVRRTGNDVRVVVTEGKVRIDPSRPGQFPSPGEREGADGQREVLLTAGNIAETRKEKVTVQQRSLPQTEQLLSWREGYLMFDEVTLADAVAEFNRYNTHKFVIKDPAIANVPVTGHFRSTSVESFATLLERGFPVAVTREKDRIILSLP